MRRRLYSQEDLSDPARVFLVLSYTYPLAILFLISDGPLSATEIEERLDCTFRNVQAACVRLEQYDLIQVRYYEPVGPGHPRKVYEVTKHGRKVVRNLRKFVAVVVTDEEDVAKVSRGTKGEDAIPTPAIRDYVDRGSD